VYYTVYLNKTNIIYWPSNNAITPETNKHFYFHFTTIKSKRLRLKPVCPSVWYLEHIVVVPMSLFVLTRTCTTLVQKLQSLEASHCPLVVK
jgi:hypothetical protein